MLQNETGMMLVSLAYNAPNGKLTATVLKCKELPAMDMNGMAGQWLGPVSRAGAHHCASNIDHDCVWPQRVASCGGGSKPEIS